MRQSILVFQCTCGTWIAMIGSLCWVFVTAACGAEPAEGSTTVTFSLADDLLGDEPHRRSLVGPPDRCGGLVPALRGRFFRPTIAPRTSCGAPISTRRHGCGAMRRATGVSAERYRVASCSRPGMRPSGHRVTSCCTPKEASYRRGWRFTGKPHAIFGSTCVIRLTSSPAAATGSVSVWSITRRHHCGDCGTAQYRPEDRQRRTGVGMAEGDGLVFEIDTCGDPTGDIVKADIVIQGRIGPESRTMWPRNRAEARSPREAATRSRRRGRRRFDSVAEKRGCDTRRNGGDSATGRGHTKRRGGILRRRRRDRQRRGCATRRRGASVARTLHFPHAPASLRVDAARAASTTCGQRVDAPLRGVAEEAGWRPLSASVSLRQSGEPVERSEWPVFLAGAMALVLSGLSAGRISRSTGHPATRQHWGHAVSDDLVLSRRSALRDLSERRGEVFLRRTVEENLSGSWPSTRGSWRSNGRRVGRSAAVELGETRRTSGRGFTHGRFVHLEGRGHLSAAWWGRIAGIVGRPVALDRARRVSESESVSAGRCPGLSGIRADR